MQEERLQGRLKLDGFILAIMSTIERGAKKWQRNGRKTTTVVQILEIGKGLFLIIFFSPRWAFNKRASCDF